MKEKQNTESETIHIAPASEPSPVPPPAETWRMHFDEKPKCCTGNCKLEGGFMMRICRSCGWDDL